MAYSAQAGFHYPIPTDAECTLCVLVPTIAKPICSTFFSFMLDAVGPPKHVVAILDMS